MQSIEELVSSLSKREKLTFIAEMIGYTEVPVDIETFLNDEYYLGKSCGINPSTGKSSVYPVWHYALAKVYPDSIRTNTFVANCGCIGCLAGDTKIKLIDGRAIPIRDLYNLYPRGGFEVYSYDIENQSFDVGTCSGVYNTGKKKLYRLRIIDKNGNISEIKCTGEHKFLLTSGVYKEAKDLSPNDSLEDLYFQEDLDIPFENHTVLTVEETDAIVDVYDMTVDKYHNYGIEDSQGNIVFVHNSGKSTMAKIILAYDIYKVTKLKDAPGYFGLMQKYLHFVIFNLTKETAEKMVAELKDWLDKSPYFRELKKDPQSVYHWITIDAASRMSDIISNDVISIVYSEMNFVRDFEAGIKLINQGISRIEGRFQKGLGLFNHVVLDSSDSTVDAPVPYFLTHHPKAKETLVFKFAIWEAKKDNYFHKFDPKTKKVTFTVYKGDSEILPCIVTPETDIRKMDPDRFLEVPNELLDDFKADIELALNDKAGVAVETTTQYFQAAYVIPHMKYDMQIPEIITIDFFGDESYIPIFEPVINRLPHDRCLFGRIDLGLKNDRCGFSLGYIEDLCPIDMDGVITFDPKVVVPVSVGISRYEGQETSIDKLSQLIIWIHSQIPFIKFTTDTFQSSAIKQKLIASEIPAEFLSVDRDTKAYKVAKQMIYKGKVTLPKSTLLKNELINLMDLGKKIDHHQNLNANGDIGSNSKDVADSLAGLLATMHDANEDCMEPPLISNTQKQRFNQKMLENWLNNQHERQMHSLRNLQLGYPEGW